MNFLKKVIVCGLFSILFTLMYYIVGEAQQSNHRVLNVITDRQTLTNLTHHFSVLAQVHHERKGFAARMKQENQQQVEKITEMQLDQLSKIRIRTSIPKGSVPKGNVRSRDTDMKRKATEEPGGKPTPISVRGIRIDYKFRRPMLKTLDRLTPDDVLIEQVTDPLHSSTKCDAPVVFLTVLVMSAPRNVQRRQQIRDTWAYSYTEDMRLVKNLKPFKGSDKKIGVEHVFRTVFVVGYSDDITESRRIAEESHLNGDMVFGGFRDDYKNLTMKTRLGLKWALFECNTAYLLKTDDDVFVNPVMLVEWLKTMPRKNVYTGWCNFNSRVVRKRGSKWYVSRQDYASDTYPGYCLGGGYLLSNDVAAKVLSKSYGRPLFPMEDLYVGLIINEMDEVRIQDERKHFDLVYEGRTDDCELNDLFLAHRVLGNSLVEHIKRARHALSTCT